MLARRVLARPLGAAAAARRSPQQQCRHSSTVTASAAVTALLRQRELLKDCTDVEALERLLTDGSAKAYLGFDPTAASLHVGHLIGLRLLLQLQAAGLPVIALVGGVTAVVGDPSGRTSERIALAPEVVLENAERLEAMLLRLLGSAPGAGSGARAPQVVDNKTWLGELRVTDLLTGAGRHMRMGAMLGKDNVRTRLASGGAGLSFAEFAYPLLQGYDWVHLARTHNCRVQVGGSDQWGNLVDGAGLVRHMLDEELGPADAGDVVGITCPLLVDSTGAKLGKSGGNAVWLDESLTSPYELYQYFRRLDAPTAHTLLKQLTDVPLAEAVELVQAQDADPRAAAAAARLGEEVVSWVHGAEAASAAVNATAALYSGSGGGAGGSAGAGDARTAAAALANALAVGGGGKATASLSRGSVVGAQLIDVCAQSGLTKSKGEARRLLTGGGLSCNEERCDPEDVGRLVVERDLLEGGLLLLRSGKKKHMLVVVED